MFRNAIVFQLVVAVLPSLALLSSLSADEFSADELQTSETTSVVYSVRIEGQISTPSEEGTLKFPLTSTGQFQFRNTQAVSSDVGVQQLRAVRRFIKAETKTVVDERETVVSLPSAYSEIHTSGVDGQLISWHPKYALLRKQADLLKMPFDVLTIQGLLPVSSVKADEAWNASSWVVPALVGLDVTVIQSVTCRLKSLTPDEAIIELEGSIEGAVTGSASNVTFGGMLTFDREAGLIRQARITMKEKRSPGPVSPGIDVTATILWSQDPVAGSTGDSAEVSLPTENQLLLSAQAPGGLKFRHSREWYLFHETPTVMMLRQLREGALIGQANFSSTVTMPPGQHTPDAEFERDIRESVAERKGKVLSTDTSNRPGWRFHRIAATGNAGEKTILWDYYLCSEKSGKQFSIVFSHAASDSKAFSGEPEKLMQNFQVPQRRRPALPFR